MSLSATWLPMKPAPPVPMSASCVTTSPSISMAPLVSHVTLSTYAEAYSVVATLLDQHIVTFQLIIIGLVVGGAIGTYLALTVEMTAMPQMVAAFNGFGGGASALVAATALLAPGDLTNVPPIQLYVATAASGIIGAATFTGSSAYRMLMSQLKPPEAGR